MRRLATLALAALAVFALATVATSLDTVSTTPTIDSESMPAERTDDGPPPGPGTQTAAGTERPQRTERTELAADSDGGDESDLPLWQVVAGLGLVLAGSVLALYGLTRGSETDDQADDDRRPPEPTAAAADSVRLSGDVPASNDVYRAWNALCRAVASDPTGRTPAAVAEAAVAAGHEPEPVAELTDAFCVVRYGDADPTGERERRARELAATLSLPPQEGAS